MSDFVRSTLIDMEKKYEGFSVTYQQTYSVESILEFIKNNQDADILYISAHGYYNIKQNMAGIMVGEEFWMASEDINVPPIVILSACHSSPRGMGAVNIADQSWKLRGDNPQCYRLEEKEFNAALEKMELIYFDRFRFNPRVDNDLRRNKRYRDLYYYYHFNKKVREKGNEITEFKVTKEYIKLVRTMQDKMIAELACKGIGIETNPSSNYLIGTIKKYEEHPILRFNSRKLKDTNTGENLCVSINTDDQGVFDTLLENEYALMTLALKKATDDDMNALYDIEDIYEWIDYVRKMGINQVFS